MAAQIDSDLHMNSRLSSESQLFHDLAKLTQENLGLAAGLTTEDIGALRDMLKQLKQKKSTPVQEGAVSSSVMSASDFSPMVLEALDGFFFVLNDEGIIDFISNKVNNYLHFEQVDMRNRSVFEFISSEDHEQFNKLLPLDNFGLPLSTMPSANDKKHFNFDCTFHTNCNGRSDTQPVKVTVSAVALRGDMNMDSEDPQMSFISCPGWLTIEARIKYCFFCCMSSHILGRFRLICVARVANQFRRESLDRSSDEINSGNQSRLTETINNNILKNEPSELNSTTVAQTNQQDMSAPSLNTPINGGPSTSQANSEISGQKQHFNMQSNISGAKFYPPSAPQFTFICNQNVSDCSSQLSIAVPNQPDEHQQPQQSLCLPLWVRCNRNTDNPSQLILNCTVISSQEAQSSRYQNNTPVPSPSAQKRTQQRSASQSSMSMSSPVGQQPHSVGSMQQTPKSTHNPMLSGVPPPLDSLPPCEKRMTFDSNEKNNSHADTLQQLCSTIFSDGEDLSMASFDTYLSNPTTASPTTGSPINSGNQQFYQQSVPQQTLNSPSQSHYSNSQVQPHQQMPPSQSPRKMQQPTTPISAPPLFDSMAHPAFYHPDSYPMAAPRSAGPNSNQYPPQHGFFPQSGGMPGNSGSPNASNVSAKQPSAPATGAKSKARPRKPRAKPTNPDGTPIPPKPRGGGRKKKVPPIADVAVKTEVCDPLPPLSALPTGPPMQHWPPGNMQQPPVYHHAIGTIGNSSTLEFATQQPEMSGQMRQDHNSNALKGLLSSPIDNNMPTRSGPVQWPPASTQSPTSSTTTNDIKPNMSNTVNRTPVLSQLLVSAPAIPSAIIGGTPGPSYNSKTASLISNANQQAAASAQQKTPRSATSKRGNAGSRGGRRGNQAASTASAAATCPSNASPTTSNTSTHSLLQYGHLNEQSSNNGQQFQNIYGPPMHGPQTQQQFSSAYAHPQHQAQYRLSQNEHHQAMITQQNMQNRSMHLQYNRMPPSEQYMGGMYPQQEPQQLITTNNSNAMMTTTPISPYEPDQSQQGTAEGTPQQRWNQHEQLWARQQQAVAMQNEQNISLQPNNTTCSQQQQQHLQPASMVMQPDSSGQPLVFETGSSTLEPSWFDLGLGGEFDMDEESTRNLVQQMLS